LLWELSCALWNVSSIPSLWPPDTSSSTLLQQPKDLYVPSWGRGRKQCFSLFVNLWFPSGDSQYGL
jgi:hypothetical protein